MSYLLAAEITTETATGLAVSIFLLVVVLALCFYVFSKIHKARKARKKETKQLKSQGMLTRAYFPHVYGLPLPENMECEVRSYPDRIEFHGGNTDITLNRSKIINIETATDLDIQKQAVSSAGGAVVGYAAFGPLGAAIGGRVKNRTVATATTYLIISYRDGDALKHIGFEVTVYASEAYKIVEEFKKFNHNTSIKINL